MINERLLWRFPIAMVRFGGSILVDFDASWTTVLAFLHCYGAIPGVEEVCYAS